MSLDLVRIAEKLEASVVLLDHVDGSVELIRLALGRKDIGPEKVRNASLYINNQPCNRT